MFAVQSSHAADRFGAEAMEPAHSDYYFDEEQLPTLKKELESLKVAHMKVSTFFETHDSYSPSDMEKDGILQQDLSDYADYNLGKQIMDCVVAYGCCAFEAEH